ncbi:MAG: membrane dipeptidase [Chlorobi bacterium]|nr:membrane dipeptidase [Chlorobiota bacterium]
MKQILVPVLSLVFLASSCKSPEQKIVERANKIHSKVLTVDTHVDTPMRLMRGDFNLTVRHDPYQDGSKVDFPRMREGGLDAVFFAVFIGQGERTPEGNEQAKDKAKKIFEAIFSSVKQAEKMAEMAKTPDDAYRLEKEGKKAVFIGMENGYPIGKDLSLVQSFYDMGARYITLCHTRNNDICDSSTDPDGPEYNGLSPFGEQVVAEMNRLGIMIDISHISDSSFFDVIRLTKAPVIASHSGARAVFDHPRNMNDDMLKALAANGGVIQVNLVSSYLRELPANPERDSARKVLREKYPDFENLSDEQMAGAQKERNALDRKYPPFLASVSDVADHIDHIVKVAGIDHVGFGSDFDGGGAVDGIFDESRLPNLTLELVKRGYTEDDLRKFWGGNLMRVFSEVEKVSRSML